LPQTTNFQNYIPPPDEQSGTQGVVELSSPGDREQQSAADSPTSLGDAPPAGILLGSHVYRTTVPAEEEYFGIFE
jgi:hypothetical protein